MTDTGRQKTRAKYQRSYRQSPEEKAKARARGAVGQAIRMGRLTRQPCQVCGEAMSEAHHEDYSRPLAVEWLCRWHHAQRHGFAISEARMATIFDGLDAGVSLNRLSAEVGVCRRILRSIRDGKHPASRDRKSPQPIPRRTLT